MPTNCKEHQDYLLKGNLNANYCNFQNNLCPENEVVHYTLKHVAFNMTWFRKIYFRFWYCIYMTENYFFSCQLVISMSYTGPETSTSCYAILKQRKIAKLYRFQGLSCDSLTFCPMCMLKHRKHTGFFCYLEEIYKSNRTFNIWLALAICSDRLQYEQSGS